MKTFASLGASLLLSAIPVRAATAPPPPYQPAQHVSGVLRLAGNPQLASLVGRWSAGFRQDHPAVRVEAHLTGSDTGMAALYTGKADIALLGRAPTASEIQAFEWIFRRRPAQVEIATGSLDRPGRSPALVIFVHRENPLGNLTLAQLDAIFGTAHRLAPANIRTWGQLGLTGEWADKPIALYAPDAMSGTGRLFRHVVLDDSRMMNWAQLTEFHDTALTGAGADDAGRQVLAALAKDRFGLAVASLGDANDQVRPVALAIHTIAAPVAATRATVASRQYPLTRTVLACYDRPPGAPPDPLVREFLNFVLDRAGQEQIKPDDGYLPLTAPLAATQARLISAPINP